MGMRSLLEKFEGRKGLVEGPGRKTKTCKSHCKVSIVVGGPWWPSQTLGSPNWRSVDVVVGVVAQKTRMEHEFGPCR